MKPDLSRGVVLSVLLVLASAVGQSADLATPPHKIEFNRDIRPLFAKHCTACHGGVKAAGKISFLYRDKALSAGKSGERAVVPFDPEKSEVIRRVITKDLDDLMPKPDHGPRLTDKEVETLRQWIREGAEWSEHWSFVPPVEPPQPAPRNRSWSVSSLDRFILTRLEAEGLKPSPAAAPASWLRRVSLDLIGLPPTAEEHDRFAKDYRKNAASAKKAVVDRLLSSPRFGERWATVWLDLARYSDTFGYEKDPHRDIWPWRDWVIRAFNEDLPYDQFTIKQLAGDLLPQPSADDLLATAFHRNTQNNTEGGTDDEEYRTVAVLDRVNTTWTAWQATTFGCTQCHSHPYDPFPQPDYYRFAAFFDNTEDCDQNDDFPRLSFPSDSAKREQSLAQQREARTLRGRLNQQGLEQWRRIPASQWNTVAPYATATAGKLTVEPNGRINASGTLPVDVKYTVGFTATPGITAIRFQIDPESDNPKRPPERGQIFSKLTAALVTPGASNRVVAVKEVIVDYLAGPRDPQNVITGDGGFGSYPVMSERREGIIILDKPLEYDALQNSKLELEISHGIAANSGFQGCPLKHFTLATTTDKSLTELAHREDRLRSWTRLKELKEQIKQIAGTPVPVMLERSDAARRETRVFIRGNRATRDEVVKPGIPQVVRPPAKEGTLDRLDLARWLVGNQNPLAARVIVNRLWAEMFGHGIVETLEDFGTTGAKPSHPELLDHLALRMRQDLKWSMKSFLREIALSSTYAQDSKASAKLLQKDPQNHLYARGPRTRLSAEMIRDQALSVSGLLSGKAFGPPVYPPQPDGIWSTVYSGEKWNLSQGEDRFRRAIYTYNRRTAGYPLFLTFDAPMRNSCTARRIASNTPLQALTTLNDPAFIEMAQALGNRMAEVKGSARKQIEHGCRLFTLTKPDAARVKGLLKLYEGALADFRKDPGNHSSLAPTPEKAALVLVANTLLNLDSSLTR